MAEDAGTEALHYRRAARKHAIGFLALLLGSFVLAFMMTRIAPPEPRGGIDWAAVAALAAAFGALATGLVAVSNLILARRAERRRARESDPALRRPAHQAQEPEAKKPEQGSGA
jgi:membrane associated rhomboid family serine protease